MRLVLGCIESKFCNYIVNTCWKALDEIYKICMLLHRSDANIPPKIRKTFGVFNYRNAKKLVKTMQFVNFVPIFADFNEVCSDVLGFCRKWQNVEKTLQLLEISRSQFRFNFQMI